MTVLVTGSNGSVGSFLVRHLLEQGDEVRAMTHYGENNLAGLDVEVVKADIRFPEEVLEAMIDCDGVYHLAALIHVDQSRRIPELHYETNVRGTMNVLEAARKTDADVLYLSSCEVLGHIDKGRAGEDWPVRQPRSPYASSKYAAEAYCWAWHHTYGQRVNVARAFNLCGPHQRLGQKGAVIPIFVDRALRGEPPLIYGSGEQIRDYTDVRDLSRGLRLLMERKGSNGDIFHFCSGRGVSVNALADTVTKALGANLHAKHVEGRPGELMRSVGDAGKALEVLGWLPRISLEQSILDVAERLILGHIGRRQL